LGKTIIEKIIQRHTDDEARPGEIVWMDLDIRSARDFGGPNVAKHYEREYGNEPVADPTKTYFTFDLCVPACTLKYADNQQICRDFAKKHGIAVFDVDKGIGSHVLMEEGLASAGKTVVGTDSHLNILGAVGCFGQGMGDVDITFAFKTGKTWFEVPESLKVTIKGEFAWPTSTKDLTLFILKNLRTEKAALKAVEFLGDSLATLTLTERITLCSMVTEMAGIIGFVPGYDLSFEQEILSFSGEKMMPIQGDESAEYSDEVEINVSGLPPQIAAPSSPTNVFCVSELTGTEIHSGFIGSCTNGRLADLEEAARVLKGKKVKEGVMLKIVPATQKVYAELLHEGVLEDLFQSGAIISNPGCGGCAEGHIGLTGQGEVQVSTGNRNFAGKQGKGLTYLASPAVVAASCVRGEICSPEDL
jgi:3-isopropylmalate/(R)-2-methylmalate dehydratase large subunit